MTRTLALSVAIAAACGALPALAQPTNAPPRGPMPFAAFDRDGNGMVTEQEFNTVHAERMAARAATGAPMRGAANAPTFADFDLNGDGRLVSDEFAAAQQALMQGRPGMGMGPGAGRGMGPGAGMGPGMGMGRGMGRNMPTFAEFDLNQNGTLTEKEFYEARANRIKERSQQGYPMRNLANAPDFKVIDLNGDGLVDQREFDLAQAQHRQQMMQPPLPPQR
ncbi:EF-hand domain-containing protein [Thiocystis violascens]|nr:EF-hand domain-containing protein [Thiocystis violascens]